MNGTLARWNDDRGFGFIKPDNGNQDIFVHISAFPKDDIRPTIGEQISFEIEDNNGKNRAIKLVYVNCKSKKYSPSGRKTRSTGPGMKIPIITLLVIVGLGAYAIVETLLVMKNQKTLQFLAMIAHFAIVVMVVSIALI